MIIKRKFISVLVSRTGKNTCLKKKEAVKKPTIINGSTRPLPSYLFYSSFDSTLAVKEFFKKVPDILVSSATFKSISPADLDPTLCQASLLL